jgi:hypothetical protein
VKGGHAMMGVPRPETDVTATGFLLPRERAHLRILQYNQRVTAKSARLVVWVLETSPLRCLV